MSRELAEGILALLGFIYGALFLAYMTILELKKEPRRQVKKGNPAEQSYNPARPMPSISIKTDNREIRSDTNESIQERKHDNGYPNSAKFFSPEQKDNSYNTNGSKHGDYREDNQQYPLVRNGKTLNLVPSKKRDCCSNHKNNIQGKLFPVFLFHIKRIIKGVGKGCNTK